MFCSFTRYALSRSLDDGQPLGKRHRRHLERCAECRQFRGRLDDMGVALVADAAMASPPQREEVVRPQRRRWATALLATSAATAVLAVVLFAASMRSDSRSVAIQSDLNRTSDQSPVSAPAQPPRPQWLARVSARSVRGAESYVANGVKLELARLSADTRRGLTRAVRSAGLSSALRRISERQAPR